MRHKLYAALENPFPTQNPLTLLNGSRMENLFTSVNIFT